MGVPKKLTEMQMKFAHEIVTNEGRMNGEECARNAGYAHDSARVRASELQSPKRFPLVVKYIGELREEYQKKYAVTFERHWSAAVNAEVARGKAAGLYIEQKIIRTGKLDDLSTDELEARMKEIIDQYSPILEGVGMDNIKESVKKKQKQLRLNEVKVNSQELRPVKKVKPIEESPSKDKNKLIEPQSSPQKIDDQDSTS